MKATLHCACGETTRFTALRYHAKPAGETPFPFRGSYRRHYDACGICGHYFGVHNFDLSKLYEGPYIDATYQSAEAMLTAFRSITSLPPENSDNVGRAGRVDRFARERFGSGSPPSLLDVGAGLGVFPHAMKQRGWNVTALDPDPRATRHIETVIGVPVVTGDFLKVSAGELGRYDVVSLNKVLEHMEDPLLMLQRVASLLTPRGFIYTEVPDVAAESEGSGREEFFIEHHHVFSPASLVRLLEAAALKVLRIERIREPSTKFTLFGFAELARTPAK
jgi:SAM-dependent methyltransferase